MQVVINNKLVKFTMAFVSYEEGKIDLDVTFLNAVKLTEEENEEFHKKVEATVIGAIEAEIAED